MVYKAVLFDLDGTLLDTLEDVGNAANRVLTTQGFPTHPVEAYRYFIGDGAKMLVTKVLPKEQRTTEMIEHCLALLREDYGKHWNIQTKPYDGVPEMLDVLEARGLKLAVLSNKPDELAKQCVRELLPKWHFDMVLGLRDEVPRKPDPCGALEVAETLHLSPKEFLYLGDTAIDMQTAVAAGMFPVGVLWGFREQRELEENGAQILIERPLDILTILK